MLVRPIITLLCITNPTGRFAQTSRVGERNIAQINQTGSWRYSKYHTDP